jgi:hypothetical protein
LITRIIFGDDQNMMVWAWHVARTCKILVEKPESKMDVEEIGCEGLDGIHLAQGMGKWRDFVNTVMNLRIT